MDTSDSEYFESADEEIQSDEETCKEIEKEPCQVLKSNLKDQDVETESKVTNKTAIEEIEEKSMKNPEKQEEHETKNVNSSPKNTAEKKRESETKNAISFPKNNAGEKGENETSSPENNAEKRENAKEDKKIATKSTENTAMNEKSRQENEPGSEQTSGRKSKSTKFKLGNKISKDAVNFNTPEKSPAPVEETKKAVKSELETTKEDDLWDEEELDWGVEGKMESELRQENIQSCIDYRAKADAPIINPKSKPNVQNKTEETSTSEGWGGWSTWGVSVLSSAGQSVSSITSQLTTVIESSLGAVDPEELAKIEREERKKLKEELGEKFEDETDDAASGGFGLGNLVKLVENTGTKVISGGLDTLETIGKKTMEVLQEGDPGLKKKRAFLKIDKDKPVLSQILREAKEKAETESVTQEIHKKAKTYVTLLDDYQGLVHLEALELLSKQCEIKLKNIQNSLTGKQYTEFLETLEQIKELCELIDDEDEEPDTFEQFHEILKNAVIEMNVQINYEKLLNHWKEVEIWLNGVNLDVCDEKELHQKAIETLAQITSMAMEQFHKFGELVLVKDQRDTGDEAVNIALVTSTIISLLGIIGAKFSEKLNSKLSQSTNKEVSELITNVFFAAANSSSYMQDALQLLIPVIQVGDV